MKEVAILIDGGYMQNLLETYFDKAKIDYKQFVDWASQGDNLFRSYYYDCLPYQSNPPSAEESGKLAKKQSFFSALKRLPRFTVRQGKLEYRGKDEKGIPIFEQKRVDLQIGLDIATLVFANKIQILGLVSGDSDLIPAIELAKNNLVIVRLIHGPKGTYHQDLWDMADERLEITDDVIKRSLLKVS